MKPKRQKHNYTSELELSSLLIREKNKKVNKNFSTDKNAQINKYIKTHAKLSAIKYRPNSEEVQKKIALRNRLRHKVIELSEITNIDSVSHERFGEIILLMIKHILTKPNFSGYTYITEFYSDAIYKILKYLHNFDHTLISERSGIRVNAFAYISQIIHNSVVFIIKKKKKEVINIEKQVSLEIEDNRLNIVDHHKKNYSTYIEDIEIEKEYRINYEDDLVPAVKKIIEKHIKTSPDKKIKILYPKSHKFTFQEYNELKPVLNGVSIVHY